LKCNGGLKIPLEMVRLFDIIPVNKTPKTPRLFVTLLRPGVVFAN
jgi:hypothetical protein